MEPNTRYAIIDIETTGGMSRRDKITEIAIIISDGTCIINQFQTLINPERSIPYEITRITGITDDMVKDAPKFYEVAAEIVNLTEDCIFVAHNVMFDYGFIRSEFESLGYSYNRKLICTVKMSRRMHPWLKSHSLENLINHFNIQVSARHRALDDAMATTTLFHSMIEGAAEIVGKDKVTSFFLKNEKLPLQVENPLTENLPNSTGVYYFRDNERRIIYIGKSKNIRERVNQHMSGKDKKTEKFIRLVKFVDFVETGSELIALLLENEEIKRYKPEINKALRSKTMDYAICYHYDQDGYLCLSTLKCNKSTMSNVLNYYSSLKSAQSVIFDLVNRLSLCESKVFISGQARTCFSYEMKLCLGACRNQETSESYNERALLAASALKNVFDKDFAIITEGRTSSERGLILVKDGHYQKFVYVQYEELNIMLNTFRDNHTPSAVDPDANRILKHHLTQQTDINLVLLEPDKIILQDEN